MKTGTCHNDFFPTEKTYVATSDERVQRYLNHYGTGPNLLLLQLVADIPRYLLISYICVKLMALLIKRLIHREKPGLLLTREQKILLQSSLPDSIESIYVRNLLRMNFNHQPHSNLFKYCPWIYRWRHDFRFSARIVCLYAAIGLLLFFITIHVNISWTWFFFSQIVNFDFFVSGIGTNFTNSGPTTTINSESLRHCCFDDFDWAWSQHFGRSENVSFTRSCTNLCLRNFLYTFGHHHSVNGDVGINTSKSSSGISWWL